MATAERALEMVNMEEDTRGEEEEGTILMEKMNSEHNETSMDQEAPTTMCLVDVEEGDVVAEIG